MVKRTIALSLLFALTACPRAPERSAQAQCLEVCGKNNEVCLNSPQCLTGGCTKMCGDSYDRCVETCAQKRQ